MNNQISRSIKITAAAVLSISFFATATVGTAALAEEPKAVKIVAPEYPRGAERRKIEGFVIIQFGIQADGSTLNPTVVETDNPGVFDAAAIKAVSKWKFEKSDAGVASTQKKLRFQLQ